MLISVVACFSKSDIEEKSKVLNEESQTLQVEVETLNQQLEVYLSKEKERTKK